MVNSVDPDQTPRSLASVCVCLLRYIQTFKAITLSKYPEIDF